MTTAPRRTPEQEAEIRLRRALMHLTRWAKLAPSGSWWGQALRLKKHLLRRDSI